MAEAGGHAATSVLLVTANVGSMFEKSALILPEWTKQFCQLVTERQPDFVAVHMQEVGGKNAVDASGLVTQFVDNLHDCAELDAYSSMRGYIDEEFDDARRFTALGSLYFVRNSLQDVALWDFSGERFHPVAGRQVIRTSLKSDSCHIKEKFPSEFSPHRLTRKGFLLTRWKLNGELFNLINVHLYHDPSNVVAAEESPSKYAANRHQALLYFMQRLASHTSSQEPMFVFGDFNFRLDLHQLVKDVFQNGKGNAALNCQVDGENVAYSDASGEVVLRLAPKEFQVADKSLFEENFHLLKPFEKESLDLGLFEQHVTFQPSYPLSEDGQARVYMETRCPAWCDRVLYNNAAQELLGRTPLSSLSYDLVGLDSCMGDHKPVYLSFLLPHIHSPATLSSSASVSGFSLKVGESGRHNSSSSSSSSSRGRLIAGGLGLSLAVPLVLCKYRVITPSSAGLLMALSQCLGMLVLGALNE